MNFPIIKVIDDVLPAIKGHDEFKVCERPFGTVINYMVQLEDSFDDPIRRECRGIIFYPDGRIMSRPFHKFFNLGEKNETRPANLDFGMDTIIMDKLDGSMVRPVWTSEDYWELGTKMGVTDVAKQASSYMHERGHLATILWNFVKWCKYNNTTPLFEWCSRQQRIVVDYPEDQLILTAIRNNYDGTYYSHDDIKTIADKFGIEQVVKTWTKGADLKDLQEYATVADDIEGWVCAWPCGKRVKIKVDWYVNLHKVKECIAREKYVIEAILGDFLDDLKGKLQEQDLKAVEAFEQPFRLGSLKMQKDVHKAWKHVKENGDNHRVILQQILEEDAVERGVKKYLATTIIPQYPKWMHGILFQVWDGKLPGTLPGVINYLKSVTSTQTQIDANRHLWGGARYNYGGVNIDE